MTRFRTLAWAAAVCTYLLIVLGAIVRITGSGLGCGITGRSATAISFLRSTTSAR